jgi:hypothetical protein
MEAGVAINTKKTKYMFMSSHQTTGQNHYIKIANKSFENAAQFEYLGTIITNQNCIHKEIKSKCLLPDSSQQNIQYIKYSV